MKPTKSNHIVLTFALLSTFTTFYVAQLSASPLGTAFTYQGQLTDGGKAVNGSFDLKFSLYDAVTNGSQAGVTLTNAATAVSNGLFTVALDFGSDVFTGNARWLEIGVRTNGSAGDFTSLSPRQSLAPSPYALYAPSAGTAASATVANSTATNTVSSASLQSNSVTTDKILDGAILDSKISTNGISGDKIIGGDLQAQRLKIGGGHTLIGQMATIAGGYQNSISNAGWSVDAIGGGQNNQIADSTHTVIGGGYQNTIASASWAATVSGGSGNTIQTNAGQTTIAGGNANTIGDNAGQSAIGGGYLNTIGHDAWGAVVGGGQGNFAGAADAVIGGGYYNSNSAWCGTIPGGRNNLVSGSYGLAAGNRAKANHSGAFVWADSTDADFASTADNQFLIRAGGGVGINKADPASALDVNGTVTATAFQGGGSALTGITGGAIADGAVVKTLNTLTDDVTIQGRVNANVVTDEQQHKIFIDVPGANNGAWDVMGNAGTVAGINFLGTTDPQPLELKVNSQRALRLEPDDTSPNVIGGFGDNSVIAGVHGATISGGGKAGNANSVIGNYGTVGGGYGNSAEGGAVVAGGTENSCSGPSSAIGGGIGNEIDDALECVIGGGGGNQISMGNYSVIGGGMSSEIGNSFYCTLGGGTGNSIADNSDYSTIGGGANNEVEAKCTTITGGSAAKATHFGQWAFANGTFDGGNAGDAQTSLYVLHKQTGGAGQVEMLLDGAGARMTVPNGATWTVEVFLVARNDAGSSAGWRFTGVIKNVGGNTDYVGQTSLLRDDGGWDGKATVDADDGNDALRVKVTGQAATNIRWVAAVRTVEVNP